MATHSVPMGDMNMTPLIDILLVLLVMLVLTIPAATHSLDIELPKPCVDDCALAPLSPVANRLSIDGDDQLLWNGSRIGQPELAGLLARTRRMKVEPELQFEPQARASYELSALTLRTIKASGVTKFGFVGNERYRTF